MRKYVGYYRVSTKQQGASGLGLEAQKEAVARYVEGAGGVLITPPFVEVESGTHSERPELKKAVAHAKRQKATLVVARLDRLSRNVHFISSLMESKVDFVACDNPTANALTIHILAAVAQEEARVIALRVKAALQAAKARGTLLGSSRPGHWEGREELRLSGQRKGTEKAAKEKRARREEGTKTTLPTLRKLKEEGFTYREIAERMEESGEPSHTGSKWSAMMIHRLLKTSK